MSTTSDPVGVLAFTSGKVFYGLLGANKAQVGSIGLAGRDVSSMVLADPTDGLTKCWAVDGTDAIVIDPQTGTTGFWGSAVLSSGAGALPTRCALTCAYKGRAVLARQPENGSIWYMSRVLNPLDWALGATPVETSAVSGTDPKLGQPHEPITCLAPYQDDYLIFGTKSTLYWMVGDPQYGGTLQVLSTQAGIVGPRAYCFDEHGVFYFMSTGGLYAMQPRKQPECISGKKLYRLLDKIDTEANRIELTWNSFRRLVIISIVPIDGSQGTHIALDPKGKSFWPIQFPIAYGPVSMAAPMGSTDGDRQTLFGCWDGIIRRFDINAFGDDGASIDSFVKYAPVSLDRGAYESMCIELRATGCIGSGKLGWFWYTANSAEEVTAQDLADFKTSGSWFGTAAGQQFPIGLRQTGTYHQLVLRQTSKNESWAMDSVTAILNEQSRTREGAR